jgi:hypothetical protein
MVCSRVRPNLYHDEFMRGYFQDRLPPSRIQRLATRFEQPVVLCLSLFVRRDSDLTSPWLSDRSTDHMSTVQWRSPGTATIPRPEPVRGRGKGPPNAEIGNLRDAMPTRCLLSPRRVFAFGRRESRTSIMATIQSLELGATYTIPRGTARIFRTRDR